MKTYPEKDKNKIIKVIDKKIKELKKEKASSKEKPPRPQRNAKRKSLWSRWKPCPTTCEKMDNKVKCCKKKDKTL